MKLSKGQKAPNFKVESIFGETIEMHEIKSNKILLLFFRYAECAFCNLRIAELNHAATKFKERDIDVIAIFQSSKESLMKSVQNKHQFQFTIISDSDLKLYKMYGVKSSWLKLLKSVSYKGIKGLMSASKIGYKPGGKVEGKFTQIPADFLLDQKKHIEIAHYGDNLMDHIPIDVILNTTIIKN